MAVNPQSPLDLDEWQEEKPVKEEIFAKSYLLELFPLLIIGVSIGMRYFKVGPWREVLIGGGVIAALVYLFFSWYILQVKKMKSLEFVLSILSGLIFPVGIAGIYLQYKSWDHANELLYLTLGTSGSLLIVSFVLLFFNASDEIKGTFYRNLIGRLLILIAILIRIYV